MRIVAESSARSFVTTPAFRVTKVALSLQKQKPARAQ
jgi:hypothetical protein